MKTFRDCEAANSIPTKLCTPDFVCVVNGVKIATGESKSESDRPFSGQQNQLLVMSENIGITSNSETIGIHLQNDQFRVQKLTTKGNTQLLASHVLSNKFTLRPKFDYQGGKIPLMMHGTSKQRTPIAPRDDIVGTFDELDNSLKTQIEAIVTTMGAIAKEFIQMNLTEATRAKLGSKLQELETKYGRTNVKKLAQNSKMVPLYLQEKLYLRDSFEGFDIEPQPPQQQTRPKMSPQQRQQQKKRKVDTN